MPGPITHIVLASKICSVAKDEYQDFIIGSIFPDIRMLGVIDRETTHFKNISFNQALNASTAFKKGFLIHSWLDLYREKYVREKNVYDALPGEYLSTVALKICEDAKLYEEYDRWSEVVNSLAELVDEERYYGITEEKLRYWHKIHQNFLSANPLETYQTFLKSVGFDEARLSELNALIGQIRKEEILETYFNDFLLSLDDIDNK